MGKTRTGLHKDISAIFDGVPLPGRNDSGSPNPTAMKTRPSIAAHRTAVKPLSSTGQSLPSNVDYNKTKPKPAKQPKPAVKKPDADNVVFSETVSARLKTWIKTKLAGVGFSYRKAAEAIAMGGLLIFFGVRVFAIVNPPSAGAEQAIADAQQEEPFDGNVDWQFPEPYAAGLRDPMVLEETATTKLADADVLEVKGVLHSKDNSFAIIGIEIATVGDVVSGATIMKINNNSVTFKKDEKVWTQKIHR